MSRILKTTAIVLDVRPVSNTSRVVQWLTNQHGLLPTLIKGSQRPKSVFLGQYDLFYTCELVFYDRRREGLRVARECYPLKPRTAFRRNWRGCMAASYAGNLVQKACAPEAPMDVPFAVLDDFLDIIAEQSTSLPALIVWFELRMLDYLGLSPRLKHCSACGENLESRAEGQYFSYAKGGLLCAACAHHADGNAFPVRPDTIAALRGWQRASHPRAILATRMAPAQLDRIGSILGHFLRYHLDTPLSSRQIALDMLVSCPGNTRP